MTDRELMQQALDALEIAEVDGNCCYEATELLRTRLAQPEQEPVTLPHQMTPEMMKKVQMFSELGAYAAENWAGAYDTFQEFWQVAISALPAAPQRKPLTDEDLRKLADKHLFYQPEGYEVSGVFALARAIEAAHGIKEKNNG